MSEQSIDLMDLSIEKRKEIYLEKARECTSFLEKKYNVKRVYVIGSLVKGKFHDRSDIDLVVEGLAPRLYIDALTDLYDLLLPGMELNLIPFEDAFDSLKRRTVREGILLNS
jgi:predicted nucleotidyltransferase